MITATEAEEVCDECDRPATSWWSARASTLYACDWHFRSADRWAHWLDTYPDGPHAVERDESCGDCGLTEAECHCGDA